MEEVVCDRAFIGDYGGYERIFFEFEGKDNLDIANALHDLATSKYNEEKNPRRKFMMIAKGVGMSFCFFHTGTKMNAQIAKNIAGNQLFGNANKRNRIMVVNISKNKSDYPTYISDVLSGKR